MNYQAYSLQTLPVLIITPQAIVTTYFLASSCHLDTRTTMSISNYHFTEVIRSSLTLCLYSLLYFISCVHLNQDFRHCQIQSSIFSPQPTPPSKLSDSVSHSFLKLFLHFVMETTHSSFSPTSLSFLSFNVFMILHSKYYDVS